VTTASFKNIYKGKGQLMVQKTIDACKEQLLAQKQIVRFLHQCITDAWKDQGTSSSCVAGGINDKVPRGNQTSSWHRLEFDKGSFQCGGCEGEVLGSGCDQLEY
jgi:hypothetical protein